MKLFIKKHKVAPVHFIFYIIAFPLIFYLAEPFGGSTSRFFDIFNKVSDFADSQEQEKRLKGVK